MATDYMKGEFELYTEKETFFNCAFLAALANGSSVIYNVKATPIHISFADYLTELGATVNIQNDKWEIIGVNFKYKKPLSLEWVGDDFPYQKRNKKIIESLLNGEPFYCEEKIAIEDSIIRELIAFGVELEWRQDGIDESDELAKRFAKIQKIKNEKKWLCNIPAVRALLAKDRFVAGDITQATFYALKASLTPNSDIIIKNVNLNPSRTGIFSALKKLGADIEITQRSEKANAIFGNLRVRSAKVLIGKRLGPDALSVCINEIPMLAVLACFAEGETIFKLPSWAVDYCKPTLNVLYENLKIAGIECGFYEEGLIVRGKEEISGDLFDCKNIPTLGLALKVLSKKAKASVKGIECIENVFPNLDMLPID